MNVCTVARLALTGFTALGALGFATAQAPHMALISDAGGSYNGSVIHKINAETGQYLGSFGAGILKHAGPLAIQRAGTTVVVADDDGLKRFSVVSGKYLGLLVPKDKIYPGKAAAIGYDFGGGVNFVEQTAAAAYRVRRYTDFYADGRLFFFSEIYHKGTFASTVSVGPRLSYLIEVLHGDLASTIGDLYNMAPTLNQLKIPPIYYATTPQAFRDAGDFRAWYGSFLRVLPSGEIRLGQGDLNAGGHVGWLGYGRFLGAAECSSFNMVAGEVTMATEVNPVKVNLYNFIDLPVITLQPKATIESYFVHGSLSGVATYRQP
ncbi:hypothetical protein [Fimbriimonas ginsengisoli]|uniref:Uncharacterized protein n=1 Tax=Fimbriimonas ginsengisoli Gsoil 348 TaxID=661478 RepID=A0A068NQY5_FIMGI|nr:hypothetical protein [Fimbriimonas ginsengisoli]AIE85792.1 hypothetical protein OP10G_2424 [Fimbriimonas ginsengisoli Gsoil 348]